MVEVHENLGASPYQRDVSTETTPSHWEIPLNPIRIGINGFRQIVRGLADF
jgi:hypothetical protein